jgi:hypothetical protein
MYVNDHVVGRARLDSVLPKHDMVIAMDENARRIFDEAYATLDRVANVCVEERDDYDEDDVLIAHRRGMPKPEPERHERRASPNERLTDSEMARWQKAIEASMTRFMDNQREMIAAAIAKQLTAADVDRMIIDHFQNPKRFDQQGKFVSDERKLWRAELEKVDLRLSALIGELTKRQIEERADVVPLKFFGRRRHA